MNILTRTSPLGMLTIGEESGRIVGLWLEGQKYFPDLSTAVHAETPVLKQASTWLDRYFTGQQPSPAELPLAPKGTAFQHAVWQILLQIPYGQTMSYAAIARLLSQRQGICRMSAQAVGGAVGHNPISIVIPCHRVLGSNGSLTGYAGGLARKQWLLNHEGIKW